MACQALFDQCYRAGQTTTFLDPHTGFAGYWDKDEPEINEDYDHAVGPREGDDCHDWLDIERHVDPDLYCDCWEEFVGEMRVIEVWDDEDSDNNEIEEFRQLERERLEEERRIEALYFRDLSEVDDDPDFPEDVDIEADSIAVAQQTHHPRRQPSDLDPIERKLRFRNPKSRRNGMGGPMYHYYFGSHGWRGRRQRTLRGHRGNGQSIRFATPL